MQRQSGVLTIVIHARLAGMDAHPHLHRHTVGPDMVGESSLCVRRRRHGIARAVEHPEHLVGAQLDLATVGRERFGQKCPVHGDQAGELTLADPLRETSRTLDVRKDKRQNPSPKHHRSLSTTPTTQ
jgi:hypothetical protein